MQYAVDLEPAAVVTGSAVDGKSMSFERGRYRLLSASGRWSSRDSVDGARPICAAVGRTVIRMCRRSAMVIRSFSDRWRADRFHR